MDVLIPAEANLKVKTGSRVKGGSTVLAVIPVQAEKTARGKGSVMAEETQTAGKGEASAEPRHVPFAVTVYRGQYGGGILCDHADYPGLGCGSRVTSIARRWRLGLRFCLMGWMALLRG